MTQESPMEAVVLCAAIFVLVDAVQTARRSSSRLRNSIATAEAADAGKAEDKWERKDGQE